MRLSKKKGFRVVNGKPCGERSPYWEWLEKHSAYLEDGVPDESPEANPDVLPESAHMFSLNLDEHDQSRLDAIMNAWAYLSDREKQAIEWYGHEGKTLEQTSLLMGVSVSRVRDCLNRASYKIKREYEKLSE